MRRVLGSLVLVLAVSLAQGEDVDGKRSLCTHLHISFSSVFFFLGNGKENRISECRCLEKITLYTHAFTCVPSQHLYMYMKRIK